jgi:hypothetical protein
MVTSIADGQVVIGPRLREAALAAVALHGEREIERRQKRQAIVAKRFQNLVSEALSLDFGVPVDPDDIPVAWDDPSIEGYDAGENRIRTSLTLDDGLVYEAETRCAAGFWQPHPTLHAHIEVLCLGCHETIYLHNPDLLSLGRLLASGPRCLPCQWTGEGEEGGMSEMPAVYLADGPSLTDPEYRAIVAACRADTPVLPAMSYEQWAWMIDLRDTLTQIDERACDAAAD